MKKSQLIEILGQFTPNMHRSFKKMLASSYFNQRQDVVDLYQMFVKNEVWEQELSNEALHTLYSDAVFDSQAFRLLNSYLKKLVEQFLIQEELKSDPFRQRAYLAQSFRKMGQTKIHQLALNEANRWMEKQPLRNAEYHAGQHLFKLEAYQIASKNKPEEDANFQTVSDTLDRSFITEKLKQTCFLLAHHKVYQWDFTPHWIEEVFAYIKAHDLLQLPAISVYYHCYFMFQFPKEEQHFQAFKTELLQNGACFTKEEIQNLYRFAINYGVRKVNDGQHAYFQDTLDFYKEGLEKKYLLNNGILSQLTYHNIVAIGLRINELDWIEQFIDQYKNKLEKRYRESSYSFNRARLAYRKKEYDEAMILLQKSNYRNMLLNLAARTLLVKIYFEKKETELLYSHLDAFGNYIRRKNVLGYHKTNYQNIIKYTRRLLNLNFYDKTECAAMREAVQREAILTEKEWLLGYL